MTTKRADEPEAGMVALLTRDAILAADDITYEYVDVPEWGGRVRVRARTGTERDAYDAESYAYSDGGKKPGDAVRDFRIRRVARCIVDENGLPLFTVADIALLGRKNAKAIDRVDDVVARLSGMDDNAVKAALESLRGGPSEGSGTA